MSDETKIVNMPVTLPVNVEGSDYSSPQFQQYLQEILQRAVLRYEHEQLAKVGASTDDRRKVVMCWETVAVTALPPGWRNAFKCVASDDGIVRKPCPAILLQECRSETESWDEPNVETGGAPFVRRFTETIHEPPFETRAVFADFEGVHLWPADDDSDYICTLGPGEE